MKQQVAAAPEFYDRLCNLDGPCNPPFSALYTHWALYGVRSSAPAFTTPSFFFLSFLLYLFFLVFFFFSTKKKRDKKTNGTNVARS